MGGAPAQAAARNGAGQGTTTYSLELVSNEGFAAELVAAQSGEGSPVAVRSWRATSASNACSQTGSVAQGWADPGSLKMVSFPAQQNPGLACEWTARERGWEALVEVVYDPAEPQLGSYAVFEVGAPGLWCCTAAEPALWCC